MDTGRSVQYVLNEDNVHIFGFNKTVILAVKLKQLLFSEIFDEIVKLCVMLTSAELNAFRPN